MNYRRGKKAALNIMKQEIGTVLVYFSGKINFVFHSGHIQL